jgi:acyl-CoA dehydrogenase
VEFNWTSEQQQIRDGVLRLCAQFDDQYWLQRDSDGEFPEAFCRALADAGWVGVAVPEAYGGSGLGTTEAAIVVQAISESGAANSGVSAVAIGLFGLKPLLAYGTEAQKQDWLPRIVRREDIACFGVTEPNTGHDTTRLKTRAERRGEHYYVSGEKVWISTAQVANKIMLLDPHHAERGRPARARPTASRSSTPTSTVSYARSSHRIDEDGPQAGVDSATQIYIDQTCPCPTHDRVGEEGKGFRYHPARPEPRAPPGGRRG